METLFNVSLAMLQLLGVKYVSPLEQLLLYDMY